MTTPIVNYRVIWDDDSDEFILVKGDPSSSSYTVVGPAVQPTRDKSYSSADGALRITDVAPAKMTSLTPATLLNAVTANGSSGPVNVSDYCNFTLTVVGAGSPTFTCHLEFSPNGTNWVSAGSVTFSGTDGVDVITVSGRQAEYARATVVSYSAGNCTAILEAGN